MMLFLCGKGQASCDILRDLWENNHKVAVFTHEGSDLQALCRKLGTICTTESVNKVASWPFSPALIVSVGYLTIISSATLKMAPCGAINCHYALLPNHRGRSAVPWAILDGDTVTGITWHWIDATIDTGDILLQATCQIMPTDTAASVFDKLHRLAHGHWHSAVTLALTGAQGLPQVGHSQTHVAGPPYGGAIQHSWTPEYVERFIRAMTYPPLPPATYCDMPVTTLADYYAARELVRDIQMEAV